MSAGDDRLALRELVDAYGIAIDERDGQTFASLFAAGGRILVFVDGRDDPVVTLATSEEIRNLAEQTHDACLRTLHFIGNHLCRVEDDRAAADTYCLAHHLIGEPGDLVDEVMLVHYRDSYVRTERGWRFLERRAHRRWADALVVPDGPLRIDRALAKTIGP
jgi:SnoaL-like domain